MRPSHTLLWLSILLVAIPSSVKATEVDAKLRFFEKHIRPSLVEHCLECHAADTEASGGLLLDSKSGWQSGGDLGVAIFPGDADASRFIRAIEYEDSDLQMPPDGRLDAKTIQNFRQWIDDGAEDPRQAKQTHVEEPTGLSVAQAQEHWSYRPLVVDSTASTMRAQSTGHPIDVFLNGKLNKADVTPVGKAKPSALLRRLTFDLTGLPPTLEQIRTFPTEPSEVDWLHAVNAMLASPAYGETFARHWLDVARYAESITLRGFVLRKAWRYRDYVVDAYCRDRPFDEMIRHQLAADLMHFDSIEEQQIALPATGFWALGNTNLEDQDKTKLEFDHIDEQLETLGRAFLGQTIGCARCHDHKFDPIPTADYYSLAAIMRSTTAMEHSNLSKWIEKDFPLPTHEEQRFQDLQSQQQQVDLELKQLLAKSNPKQKVKRIQIQDLPGVVVDDGDAKRIGFWEGSSHKPGYVGDGYLHDGNQDRGDKTLTFEPKHLPTGRYEVRMAYTSDLNRSTRTQIRVFSANETSTISVNQRATAPIDGIWLSLGVFPFETDGLAFVMISNEDADGYVVADAVQFLPVDQTTAPQTNEVSTSGSNPEDARRLQARVKALKQRKQKIEVALSNRPKYLTILEGEPRQSLAVRLRGNTHQKGPTVRRGVLTAIGNAKHWTDQMDSSSSGRLQLANWIADSENPLTARVYANRVWCWLMGEGIVSTENNFGTTGESPTHPELLDFLAAELIQNNWSTKHLVRLIVTSDAYQRRVSADDPAAVQVDPENRLYWRSNLKRLPVEAMRDAMLSISGELDLTVGGSTIRKGISSDYEYTHDSLRRSIYLPAFRNSLPPLFEAFDFADNSVSVGQRSRSTVPTQSLTMLNHPWIIQRAQTTAKRLRDRLNASDVDSSSRDELVERLYLLCLGRVPSEKERKICHAYLADGLSQHRLSTLTQTLFASIDFRYLD